MPSKNGERYFPMITINADISDGENADRMKEMIRAGAVFPKAIPGAFSHPPESLDLSRSRGTALITSRRNTRPMPAFGATRDEGAVGPIAALSPYVLAARSQCYRPAVSKNWKPCQTLRPKPLRDVVKGPTAKAILSMAASRRKPPVPEAWRIERQKKSLSRITTAIEEAAAYYKLEDNQWIDNNGREKFVETFMDRIPGYRETWGVAFSQKPIEVQYFGPGGAKYPEDYPPGIIQSQKKLSKDLDSAKR